MEQAELEKSILKLTRFVAVGELATMMDISVADISQLVSLGLFVSINNVWMQKPLISWQKNSDLMSDL